MDLLIAVYYVLVCGKYLYLICSSYEWIYQFSVLCALACGNYSFLICGDWYKKVNKSTQTTEHVHRHHHYQTNTHSATLKPRFLEYILWSISCGLCCDCGVLGTPKTDENIHCEKCSRHSTQVHMLTTIFSGRLCLRSCVRIFGLFVLSYFSVTRVFITDVL